tara:strand:+ start:242 stop:565 length:324 start_codon:yes stop_codon:yes gene_type:complete
MPKVGKMKFPYTEQGMKDAQNYSKQSGKPMQMEGGKMAPKYGHGGMVKPMVPMYRHGGMVKPKVPMYKHGGMVKPRINPLVAKVLASKIAKMKDGGMVKPKGKKKKY